MAVRRALRFGFCGSVVLGLLPFFGHLIVSLFRATPYESWFVDILMLGMSVVVGGVMSGLKLLTMSGVRFPSLLLLLPVLIAGVFSIAVIYALVLAGVMPPRIETLFYALVGVGFFAMGAYVVDVRYTALSHESSGKP